MKTTKTLSGGVSRDENISNQQASMIAAFARKTPRYLSDIKFVFFSFIFPVPGENLVYSIIF